MTHSVLTDRERSSGAHARGALLSGMVMGGAVLLALQQCAPVCVWLGSVAALWRSHAELLGIEVELKHTLMQVLHCACAGPR